MYTFLLWELVLPKWLYRVIWNPSQSHLDSEPYLYARGSPRALPDALDSLERVPLTQPSSPESISQSSLEPESMDLVSTVASEPQRFLDVLLLENRQQIWREFLGDIHSISEL